MTDVELFACKFNLDYWNKHRLLINSIHIRKLMSRLGTREEVVKYLEHRKQQLVEAGFT